MMAAAAALEDQSASVVGVVAGATQLMENRLVADTYSDSEPSQEAAGNVTQVDAVLHSGVDEEAVVAVQAEDELTQLDELPPEVREEESCSCAKTVLTSENGGSQPAEASEPKPSEEWVVRGASAVRVGNVTIDGDSVAESLANAVGNLASDPATALVARLRELFPFWAGYVQASEAPQLESLSLELGASTGSPETRVHWVVSCRRHEPDGWSSTAALLLDTGHDVPIVPCVFRVVLNNAPSGRDPVCRASVERPRGPDALAAVDLPSPKDTLHWDPRALEPRELVLVGPKLVPPDLDRPASARRGTDDDDDAPSSEALLPAGEKNDASSSGDAPSSEALLPAGEKNDASSSGDDDDVSKLPEPRPDGIPRQPASDDPEPDDDCLPIDCGRALVFAPPAPPPAALPGDAKGESSEYMPHVAAALNAVDAQNDGAGEHRRQNAAAPENREARVDDASDDEYDAPGAFLVPPAVDEPAPRSADSNDARPDTGRRQVIEDDDDDEVDEVEEDDDEVEEEADAAADRPSDRVESDDMPIAMFRKPTTSSRREEPRPEPGRRPTSALESKTRARTPDAPADAERPSVAALSREAQARTQFNEPRTLKDALEILQSSASSLELAAARLNAFAKTLACADVAHETLKSGSEVYHLSECLKRAFQNADMSHPVPGFVDPRRAPRDSDDKRRARFSSAGPEDRPSEKKRIKKKKRDPATNPATNPAVSEQRRQVGRDKVDEDPGVRPLDKRKKKFDVLWTHLKTMGWSHKKGCDRDNTSWLYLRPGYRLPKDASQRGRDRGTLWFSSEDDVMRVADDEDLWPASAEASQPPPDSLFDDEDDDDDDRVEAPPRASTTHQIKSKPAPNTRRSSPRDRPASKEKASASRGSRGTGTKKPRDASADSAGGAPTPAKRQSLRPTPKQKEPSSAQHKKKRPAKAAGLGDSAAAQSSPRPDGWEPIWTRLQADGWSYEWFPKSVTDVAYLRPGVTKEDAVLGFNAFATEKDVLDSLDDPDGTKIVPKTLEDMDQDVRLFFPASELAKYIGRDVEKKLKDLELLRISYARFKLKEQARPSCTHSAVARPSPVAPDEWAAKWKDLQTRHWKHEWLGKNFAYLKPGVTTQYAVLGFNAFATESDVLASLDDPHGAKTVPRTLELLEEDVKLFFPESDFAKRVDHYAANKRREVEVLRIKYARFKLEERARFEAARATRETRSGKRHKTDSPPS